MTYNCSLDSNDDVPTGCQTLITGLFTEDDRLKAIN